MPDPYRVSIEDLCGDSEVVLRRLQESLDPVVITQRGRAVAVMLGKDTYEKSERERHLSRQLLRGEQEMVAGMGHDLDEVLAEADTILADGRV